MPTRMLRATSVAVGLVVTAALVYATGGTSRVGPHLLYLPIVAAAFWFGIRGGVVAALAAGLLIGPAMPPRPNGLVSS